MVIIGQFAYLVVISKKFIVIAKSGIPADYRIGIRSSRAYSFTVSRTYFKIVPALIFHGNIERKRKQF